MKPLLIVIAALALSPFAQAQCINTGTPSCQVYQQCFAKYCPCQPGRDEYFLTYGEKYCKAFLDNPNFTPAGMRWRDSTLKCLQESIVPSLDISPDPQCNCATMKQAAFAMHVSCYTKADASICALPLADLNQIIKTIDRKDTFSTEGWQQMYEVAKVCVVNAVDDGRRAIWESLESTLRTR